LLCVRAYTPEEKGAVLRRWRRRFYCYESWRMISHSHLRQIKGGDSGGREGVRSASSHCC